MGYVIKKEGDKFVARDKKTGEIICPSSLKLNGSISGLMSPPSQDVGRRSMGASQSVERNPNRLNMKGESNGRQRNEIS